MTGTAVFSIITTVLFLSSNYGGIKMKRWFFILPLSLGVFCLTSFLFGNLTMSKVGEWGTGYYEDVFVKGNYAYCAANFSGVDIIDISNPAAPRKIANYQTPCRASSVFVSGNYVYVGSNCGGFHVLGVANPSTPYWVGGCSGSGKYVGSVCVKNNYAYASGSFSGNLGFEIIDVSNASSPAITASYYIPDPPGSPHIWSITGITAAGNYVYLTAVFYDGLSPSYGELHIVDVSNPFAPVFAGKYTGVDWPRGVAVENDIAYVTDSYDGVVIIDVSTPGSPSPVGSCPAPDSRGIGITDNYAYVTSGESGLQVLDISTPASPTLVGSCDTPGFARRVFTAGNCAFVADDRGGLQIIDVSTPSTPASRGAYDASGAPLKVHVKDNYAYILDQYEGLIAVDVSNPASPTGVFRCDTGTCGVPKDIFVKGDYVYAADSGAGLRIIDISTPSTPTAVGNYPGAAEMHPHGVEVTGDYAYVADVKGLRVLDVSNPANPALVGGLDPPEYTRRVDVEGNYAFVTYEEAGNGVLVIDISDPTSPRKTGNFISSPYAWDVSARGNYAYVAQGGGGLTILDVSDPTNPAQLGNYTHQDYTEYYQAVSVNGNYAFLSAYNLGLHVLDISDPASPRLASSYGFTYGSQDVCVQGDYVYLTEKTTGKLHILRADPSGAVTYLNLSRSELTFALDASGAATGSQSFFISSGGTAVLNWSLGVDAGWLVCSPVSGTGGAEVTVSVNAADLAPGTYTGRITVTAPGAYNSPRFLDVTLEVYGMGQSTAPFGSFDTPTGGSTVRGGIPVTGWALDDIGMQSVKIYREADNSLIYIGDAVFVEGARPDVALAYPGYPANYKAGWGYMMLTNFLPGGGNSTYKIHAIATDLEGHQFALGTKTITCDNAHAVKPFGAIDTPAQGGTASGGSFVNYGWVLTPQPNAIPIDGSTINVWVDGVSIGNPVYNLFRQDIADFFPGYANSNGAVGYFYLDTTAYENGVHTIQWTAADDAGNSDGIGSRYFMIQNNEQNRTASTAAVAPGCFRFPAEPADYVEQPVRVRKGYNADEPYELYPDENGIISVDIEELERLEIHFFKGGNSTSSLSPLPIGATLDAERGIFYWSPGPGFLGNHRLVFIETGAPGCPKKQELSITIRPGF
jgi:hypothetical protein